MSAQLDLGQVIRNKKLSECLAEVEMVRPNSIFRITNCLADWNEVCKPGVTQWITLPTREQIENDLDTVDLWEAKILAGDFAMLRRQLEVTQSTEAIYIQI